MAYSSNLITLPIGLTDIQQALSSGSNDVGSLCLRPNINMWARYKPIKYAEVGRLTTAQWNAARHGVYRSSSLPLFDINMRLNHDVWTYDKPTGGASSPYRMTDFARYYHIAPCPVRLIFPSDVIPLNDTATQDTLAFTFTFEQGIGQWRSDDCCLYMRDIFYEGSSLNSYLTVGLIHYITNNYVGYFKSSNKKLSDCVAAADGTLQGTPIAQVFIDLADFVSKVNQAYRAADVKWQAVMFLCSSQLDGATSISGGMTTELLQYDGHVTQDSDGYEEGCDRHIMTIQKVSWAGDITGMTLTTKYTKVNTSDYKISQMTISVTRSANLPAWSLGISLEAIIVGGVMQNTQSQTSGTFTPSTVQYVTFAQGVTSASVTLVESNFTGKNYQFRQLGQGNICRAILNCNLTMSSGSKSLATDCDCSAGTAEYNITNQI